MNRSWKGKSHEPGDRRNPVHLCQGHGVGFWEEDYGTPESCKRLDEAAKAEGTCYVDLIDGKLEYCS